MGGPRGQRRDGHARRRAPRARGRAAGPSRRLSRPLAAALSALLLLAGCGGTRRAPVPHPLHLPPDYLPLPAGRSRGYRLSPTSAAVARRAPVAGLRCGRSAPRSFAIHLELYADRRVLPVPAGIGIAPPLRRRGAYVTGGACLYPIRSTEPTGLVLVGRAEQRLAALFAVWGQPLSARRLAGFAGPVAAYLAGRRWRGDPARIPLHRHAEIVLEVGAHVPPHSRYLFPPGA